MISAAIFGAAAGTGLALVVAMTIVVYRYYAVKRKGKYWSDLDRWPDPPSTRSKSSHRQNRQQDSQEATASHVLNCWNKPQKSYYAVQIGEFNVTKEQHAVQPSSMGESGGLPHQSRSYPSGSGSSGSGGSIGRFFGRNSSVSSQSSLEGSSGSSNRASSPQIRAFGPDGRYHRDAVYAASSYPPSRSSRSPSPGRPISVDARCGSPASCSGSPMSNNASPSQGSLSSLATGLSYSCGCSSSNIAQNALKGSGRNLLPLLIPPPRSSFSEGGPAPPASPLGSLQPDLYQPRVGPIFLAARRARKSLGRVHLRMDYDFDRSDLLVHLIEAHHLASVEKGGFSDPYVTLNLSPEVDSRKRQTEIFTNDPNPVFDQQFKFPVSHEELQEKTLILQVIDGDRFSRNDVVGLVRITMGTLQLASSIEVWGEIEPERKPRDHIQEVKLTLSYLPSAGRLTVIISEARNLFPPQEKKTLDCFVKVNLLCGESRVKKKKTPVKKDTTSPIWNESIHFKIPAASLASSAIEVCVMESRSELIGGNVIVGSCIVGPAKDMEGACSQGREHWIRMTNSPRESITMWHTLH